jgi:hypothetical protein
VTEPERPNEAFEAARDTWLTSPGVPADDGRWGSLFSFNQISAHAWRSKRYVNAAVGSASADSLEILLIDPLPFDDIDLLHHKTKEITRIAWGTC